MTISKLELLDLLSSSSAHLKDLSDIYQDIPDIQCQRKAECCKMLPEMTFLEAIAALNQLKRMDSSSRTGIFEDLVRYFFFNPVQISSCPFLDRQQCLIYENRFFGCRAYGLWSRSYYEKLSKQELFAKSHLKDQWKKLGISLPEHVVSFYLPYCLDAQISSNKTIDDDALISISESIEAISRNFSDHHISYMEQYFSDFSFLITSLFFGYSDAVRIKFQWVKEYLESNNDMKAEQIKDKIQDFLA